MRQLALPRGFLFSSCAAGIKPSGNPDLALALAPKGASTAAMFTRNQIVAAPLIVGREHLGASKGRVRAVIVNSGNANCATGRPGLRAARKVCNDMARAIKAAPKEIFPSSTGIIGVQLPVEKITAAIPSLVAAAEPGFGGFEAFAQAIMTTDTHAKVAGQTIAYRGSSAAIAGAAKGAGMIHPNLATMLVYLFTDIEASPRELQAVLAGAADQSFNNISIDGDTSTNDTVLLLASGASGIKLKPVREEFAATVTSACRSLASQIVADGEGVRHVVRLRIEQARTREEGRRVASAIANSPLVKTAWAGADPNWGRILAAIGYSGVLVRQQRVNIYLGDQQVCRKGAAYPFDKALAHAYMMEPVYDIRVILGAGSETLEYFSCDLTAEYVRVNAEYST